MHTLIEVLKLQLALLLGTSRPNAMGTFNPLLLKSMAARRPLVRLLSALQQQPAIQVDAKSRLQVHKGHDADDGGAERDAGEGGMTDKTRCGTQRDQHCFIEITLHVQLKAIYYLCRTPVFKIAVFSKSDRISHFD